MTRDLHFRLMFIACLAGLGACGGGGSGEPQGQPGNQGENNVPGGQTNFASSEEFFDVRVAPLMNFCRTCHIPGGVADSDEGKRFMLSSNSGDDYANTHASWQALGEGVEDSLLIIENADKNEPHSGGKNWPAGSEAYNDMVTLLTCWDDPANCALQVVGGITEQLPLLGSSHARSYMTAYCADKPDDAVLPQDPRELIRPGINEGRSVAFNAYWQNCTEASGNPNTKPVTCGEFRERRELGKQLMRNELAMQLSPAEYFNLLWLKWGLPGRPDDFDAQLRERYGLAEANFPNPYPLQGENPNAADGGSGNLPAGLTQVRNEDGSYTGMIGITCDLCHTGGLDALGGTADERFVSGLGNHNLDGQLALADFAVPLLPIALSSTRGTTNAMGLSGFLIGLVDFDSLAFDPVNSVAKALMLQIPGNTSGGGDTKMPAWWNASHRPRKFWDAGYSYDAMRLDNVILQATGPILSPGPAGGKAMRDLEPHAAETQVYLDSLESPPYPGEIDTALAEQGAVLFHAKDLWADGELDDIPAPPTNGSCAGCHGAYSPRYVQDASYLEDVRLAGMAGYVSPIEQIGTDPARLEGFTAPLFEILSTGWLSYPEGSEGYVSPEEKDPLSEAADDYSVFYSPGTRPEGACHWQGAKADDATGYLTPPLHGIWATAPYLHNGSVPDVWSLLKPEARPPVWRRELSLGAGPERGYATTWDAYDQQRMGWKYDEVGCAGCPEGRSPLAPLTDFLDMLVNFTGTQNSLGYQSFPPIGRQGVEDRKVFNTRMFAKGNSGHEFGRALTDAERHAIIEYLKTL